MIKNRLLKALLIFGMLLLVAGCSSATRSISRWKDPAFSEAKFDYVLVVCILESEGNQRLFEDEFVKQLQEKNIKAVASYTLFSLKELDKNKDADEARIKKEGFDSILVARTVDRVTEQKYYPPTVSYMGPPGAYYGGWYDYYHMGFAYTSTPGYTRTYDVVKLECNIYDLANDKLLFSGLSDTTISSGSKLKVSGIVKSLLKDIAEEKK